MRRCIQHLFRISSIGWMLLIVSLLLPLSAQARPEPPGQSSGYNVIGPPTVSAAFIDKVLSTYSSPAAGEGQALYNGGIKYGIDPAFALAFFLHESSFGTAGVAQYTLSLGNLRCIPDAVCQNGYAAFPSWDAGIDAWYSLIRNLYVNTWGLTTVEQIIPRYAPPSDNNNDAAYINGVESAIDAWRSQQTTVPTVPVIGNGQVPTPSPTITSKSGTHQTPAISYPPDGYTIIGKPTISAQYIDKVLTRYHSPAAGKGQALYDAGAKANIDPIFALAFFLHDSIFGTVGMAKVTLAIGNIPSSQDCHCQDFHGYRRYDTWEAGFSDWYQFISDHYVSKGVKTIGQIVPDYSATKDSSLVKSFIKTVEYRVGVWRKDFKQQS